jgi:hypothetical protein
MKGRPMRSTRGNLVCKAEEGELEKTERAKTEPSSLFLRCEPTGRRISAKN